MSLKLRWLGWICIAWLVGPWTAWADDDKGILGTAPGFKPSFNFSETHTETIVNRADPSAPGGRRQEWQFTQKKTLTLTANLQGVDVSSFNEDTWWGIRGAGFDRGGQLSSDPKYVKGKTSVSVQLDGFDPNTGRPLTPSVVKLAWTAKVLTMSVTLNSGTALGNGDPPIVQDQSSGGKLSFIESIAIEIGGATGSTLMLVKGSATLSEKLLDGVPCPLFNYHVTGAIDTTAPTLTVIAPAQGVTFFEGVTPIIYGTVSDAVGLLEVQTSDPLDSASIWTHQGVTQPQTPTGAFLTGKIAWSCPGPNTLGVHTLAFRAVDLFGNASAPVYVTYEVIAPYNALQRRGSFQPALKLNASRTYRSKKAASGEVVQFIDDKGSLTMTANLEGGNVAALDTDTVFHLTINNADLSVTLGDDPAYAPGKTNATIRSGGMTLKLAWTAKALTVTLTYTLTSQNEAAAFPLFDDLLLPGTPAGHRALVLVSFAFAQHQGSTVGYSLVKGAAAESLLDEVSVLTGAITLLGDADTQAPALTIMENDDASEPGFLILRGKVTEGCQLAQVQWSPDFDNRAVAVQTATVTLAENTPALVEGDEWGPTISIWEVKIPAPAGAVPVSLRAIDAAGNISKAISLLSSRPLAYNALAGTWQGLLDEVDGTPADARSKGSFSFGRVTMTTSTKGTVSGKIGIYPLMTADIPFTGVLTTDADGHVQLYSRLSLVRGSAQYWLRGEFIATGEATNYVMQLDLLENSSSGDSQSLASGAVHLAPYDKAKLAPEDLRGLHNAAITNMAGFGYGFFAVTVAKSGAVAISGRLPDGTPLTWSGLLTGSDQLALAAPFPKQKGGAFGVIDLRPNLTCEAFSVVGPAPAMSTDPAPRQVTSVTGSRYLTPLNLKEWATIVLDFSVWDEPLQLDFWFARINPASGAILPPSPNPRQFRMSVTAATGAVTGSYRTTDGKSLNFTALFQQLGDSDYYAYGQGTADSAPGQSARRHSEVRLSLEATPPPP